MGAETSKYYRQKTKGELTMSEKKKKDVLEEAADEILAEKTADKDILKYYKHIEEISNMYPYQARLPYFIEF